MASKRYLKDPDSYLDYGFDWSDWLQNSETLSHVDWYIDNVEVLAFSTPSATPSATPSETPSIAVDTHAALKAEDRSNTTTQAVIWLRGGIVGTEYEVACRITTTGNRIDERTLLIYIVEK